jgi:hypothetical protein
METIDKLKYALNDKRQLLVIPRDDIKKAIKENEQLKQELENLKDVDYMSIYLQGSCSRNDEVRKLKQERDDYLKNNTTIKNMINQYLNDYHFTPTQDYVKLLNEILNKLKEGSG